MPTEPVKSVMLAGRGLLRWPGGEERVHYRVTVGFHNAIEKIWIGASVPEILHRPSRHGDIFLHMPEGRRLKLKVAPNGHLTPDGPLERSLDGQGWWLDTTPWLPFETPDRYTLAMRAGSVQIFESHQNPEDAEAAFHKSWQNVDVAEIRPPFGRPVRLK
ncbi:MAG: hypothetical protein JOZ62_18270 [Acidobacteriaceae bacterium]|nr:hypothetical protein [Acidobacteriaceae bacterium]